MFAGFDLSVELLHIQAPTDALGETANEMLVDAIRRCVEAVSKEVFRLAFSRAGGATGDVEVPTPPAVERRTRRFGPAQTPLLVRQILI